MGWLGVVQAEPESGVKDWSHGRFWEVCRVGGNLVLRESWEGSKIRWGQCERAEIGFT